MKLGLFVIVFSLFFLPCQGQKEESFELVGSHTQAVIVLPKTESEAVRLAAEDLVSDIQKITGKTIEITSQKPTQGGAILIQTTPKNSEVYRLTSQNKNLLITGESDLGTVFGIYHFIEHYLGVDPMYFWNDKEPEKKTRLFWEKVDYQSVNPTFKFRGWFINDEDLLTEWYASGGKRNIDYPYYQEVVSPKIMEKVCETALRKKFNLIIPASFIDIRNPAEAALVKEATKRGLYVSMHHVEPMGVSAFTYFNYWKEKEGSKPLFSYYSNPEKVKEVWRLYAQEWAKIPNVIWQIGLRGIADRPMWMADPNTPQTDAERGKLISEAMAFQRQLIKEVDKRPNPPVTTTLWAEGSTLNQAGHLKIPDNVTVVFADNSPGWRWQADFFETKRVPTNQYGVYYHHQLWGSGPHLVPIVSPAQTERVLRQAVEKGDTEYCILNVSNIREFGLGIDASAQMLWDFNAFDLQKFNNQWFEKYYHQQANDIQKIYQAYFDSFRLNPQSHTPILMDGQTNQLATRALNDLKLQLTDSVKYQALLKQRKQESEESKWAKSLGDMSSGNLSREDLLEEVLLQKNALLNAEKLAHKVEQTPFFKTDFLAHLKIMLALTTWLEHVMKAKLALDHHELTQAKQLLREALLPFESIREAQALKTQGEKWALWYRGEKKMNLKAKEKLTLEVVELLK